MVTLDSSALIPLSWVGRLDLIWAAFDDLRTTTEVREEVLVEGKPGTASLRAFLEDVAVHETPDRAGRVATMEGIAVADASVLLLASAHEDLLLANDRALIEVARSHGVECYWVTTLLLGCTKEGVVDAEEAKDVLYDLVDAGMNLDPQVYAQVQRRLETLGE